MLTIFHHVMSIVWWYKLLISLPVSELHGSTACQAIQWQADIHQLANLCIPYSLQFEQQ